LRSRRHSGRVARWEARFPLAVQSNNLFRIGALVQGCRRVCLMASHTTSAPPTTVSTAAIQLISGPPNIVAGLEGWPTLGRYCGKR
jgi:hypothetical protein